MNRRRLLAVAIPGALLTLIGSPSPASDGQALKLRVEAYWNARRDSDLAAAYEFYSPDFRKRVTRAHFLSGYRRLARFPPRAFELADTRLTPDGQAATVRVKLSVRNDFDGHTLDVETFADEEWIYDQRQWWKKDETLQMNV